MSRRVLCSNKVVQPKVFSPRDKVHANHTGTYLAVKNTVTLELQEWPHLTTGALDAYEQAVQNAPNHIFSTAGTHPVLTHNNHSLSFQFSPQESETFVGFDLSVGNRAFTAYPRQQGGRFGVAAAEFQKYIRAKLLPGTTSEMTEDDPRHVWIHPQGLTTNQHLANHWHLMWTNGSKIQRRHLELIIEAACGFGIIHPPGYTSSVGGREAKKYQLTLNRDLPDHERATYEQRLISKIGTVLST